jgi:hypothetical protein
MRQFMDIMEGAQGGTFTVFHGTAADFNGFEDSQLGSAHYIPFSKEQVKIVGRENKKAVDGQL